MLLAAVVRNKVLVLELDGLMDSWHGGLVLDGQAVDVIVPSQKDFHLGVKCEW